MFIYCKAKRTDVRIALSILQVSSFMDPLSFLFTLKYYDPKFLKVQIVISSQK